MWKKSGKDDIFETVAWKGWVRFAKKHKPRHWWTEDQTFEHRSVIAEVNVGEKHYEIPAEAKTWKNNQKGGESEGNTFSKMFAIKGCH